MARNHQKSESFPMAGDRYRRACFCLCQFLGPNWSTRFLEALHVINDAKDVFNIPHSGGVMTAELTTAYQQETLCKSLAEQERFILYRQNRSVKEARQDRSAVDRELLRTVLKASKKAWLLLFEVQTYHTSSATVPGTMQTANRLDMLGQKAYENSL